MTPAVERYLRAVAAKRAAEAACDALARDAAALGAALSAAEHDEARAWLAATEAAS